MSKHYDGNGKLLTRGVRWSDKHQSYIASITVNGNRKQKTFAKYESAKIQRKKWEKSFGKPRRGRPKY